jgi:hypothetical protein
MNHAIILLSLLPYQLHEQGLLEQQEIDGIFFWRKKRDIQ